MRRLGSQFYSGSCFPTNQLLPLDTNKAECQVRKYFHIQLQTQCAVEEQQPKVVNLCRLTNVELELRENWTARNDLKTPMPGSTFHKSKCFAAD